MEKDEGKTMKNTKHETTAYQIKQRQRRNKVRTMIFTVLRSVLLFRFCSDFFLFVFVILMIVNLCLLIESERLTFDIIGDGSAVADAVRSVILYLFPIRFFWD